MLCDTKHIVQVVNNMKRHYPRALHSFFYFNLRDCFNGRGGILTYFP